MIPPHEINNKEFSRVVRGYSIPEVDEYIAYLREQYTELYRENDALQRRLSQAETELGELKAEESDIRAALITAQKAGKKIITDANARAGRITMQTRIDCEKILEDFRRESAQERETLSVLKGQVANLKQRLFEMYSSHISMIEQITPNINEDIAKMSAITDDEYAASLAAEIRGKSGVDEIVPTSVGADETVSDEELAALARVFGDLSAKTPEALFAKRSEASDGSETDDAAQDTAAEAVIETEIEPEIEPAAETEPPAVPAEPQVPLAVDEAEELLSLLRRKAEEKQAAEQAAREDIQKDTQHGVQAAESQTPEQSEPAAPNEETASANAADAEAEAPIEAAPEQTLSLQAEDAFAAQPEQAGAPQEKEVAAPQGTIAQAAQIQPQSETAAPENDAEAEEGEENEDIFDTLRRLNEVFGAGEEEDTSAREFFDSLSSSTQKKAEDDPTELSIEEQLRRAYPDRENE